MQTCMAPTAVTIHVNVHPFAWNMGSVHDVCMHPTEAVAADGERALRDRGVEPLARMKRGLDHATARATVSPQRQRVRAGGARVEPICLSLVSILAGVGIIVAMLAFLAGD